MESKITEARKALEDAELRMQSAADAIETADEGADLAVLEGEFDVAVEQVEARKASLQRYEKVAEARKAAPSLASDARVTREEPTYRPDAGDGRSFFRDLINRGKDREANERLMRHEAETRSYTTTTIDTSGGGFIVPAYMLDQYITYARPGQAFAEALRSAGASSPLPDTGMTVVFPRVDTGSSVAAQQEGNSTSKTDAVTSQYSVPVRTVSGRQDVTVQLLSRSTPQFDQVIFADLARAHAAELDRQLIRGASASYEHVGLHNVSGSVNTVSYTDASPTGAELLPKVYDAIQKIMSTRYLPPTHIVMHPRRAAWLASTQSSTYPLFQQGGLYRAAGEQDMGIVGTFAGLPVVADPNVGTTYGATTDADEIYVLHAPSFLLMEGPIATRVMEQPLSADLAVRLDLFSFSAFASRYPSALAIVSGTGLVSPTF